MSEVAEQTNRKAVDAARAILEEVVEDERMSVSSTYHVSAAIEHLIEARQYDLGGEL